MIINRKKHTNRISVTKTVVQTCTVPTTNALDLNPHLSTLTQRCHSREASLSAQPAYLCQSWSRWLLLSGVFICIVCPPCTYGLVCPFMYDNWCGELIALPQLWRAPCTFLFAVVCVLSVHLDMSISRHRCFCPIYDRTSRYISKLPHTCVCLFVLRRPSSASGSLTGRYLVSS